MGTREEVTQIFKRNRRLAELNPEIAAAVLAGQDSAIRGSVARRHAGKPFTRTEVSAPERGLVPLQSSPLQPLVFTVPGSPVPKPRQTHSDKWKKRPSVLRYRAWADSARVECHNAKRAAFPDVRFDGEIRYGRIKAVAFFKMPGSWNSATKTKMRGQPHCLRPDADNLLKAVGDSLFPTGDEHLHDLQIIKRWDDGNGARTVITLF